MFGLYPNSYKQILSIFQKHENIEKVIIYGSRAKGNYREGSDIDLTLQGEHLTSDILSKITTALDDSYSPYLFDLSIYQQLSDPDFIDHINRVGQIFYQREPYDKQKL